MLLRRVIGDALRARRQAQHRTLRQVSTAANVSLGYLSEIERGQKEASSELLAAICEALGAALSEVLRDVSDTLAVAEELPRVLVPVGGGGDQASEAEPAVQQSPAPAQTGPDARMTTGRAGRATPNAKVSVADNKLSVAVHLDGPLKTTLRATRTPRDRDVVYAA